MVLISPSLLAANFLNLQRDIENITKAGADRLHIDIMDGHYVPNLSFGPAWVHQIRQITSLPIDVHLMVKCLEKWIPVFAEIKVDCLTIHHEATYHPYRFLQQIREYGLEAGIALNPGTALNTIYPLLDQIDVIVLMSVNPGFGGQQFLPSVLQKIKDLKTFITAERLSIKIEVDGGINHHTAGKVRQVGADILVSGNYLFNNNPNSSIETYAERIKQLRRL